MIYQQVTYLSLPRTEWERMSLRELTLRYETILLEQWDRVAVIKLELVNLHLTVMNLFSKQRPKPKELSDVHPYRSKGKKEGIKITPKNMHVLKSLGKALANRK